MKYLLLLLLYTASIFAKMSALEQFEQFEREDKRNFALLKQKIESCIDAQDFACAQKNLKQIKQYVTSKHDVQTIRKLQTTLAKAKERKRALAHRSKSITISDCQYTKKDTTMCTLYVNGKYDGNILYRFEDRKYTIFILGSKNAATTEGFYDPELYRVWTTRCGDSKSHYGLKIAKALYMFANCAINGKY